MKVLTWDDFDWAVDAIAGLCHHGHMTGLRGVYGLPRGGLPLAVALSHRMGLPLFLEPAMGLLVVDDVVETGRAMAEAIRPGCLPVAWISKRQPGVMPHVEAMVEYSTDLWIVFPWENASNANLDAEAYRASH